MSERLTRISGFEQYRDLLQRRLDTYTVKTDTCWLWTAKRHQGYGYLCITRDRYRLYFRAHRLAWALKHGYMPDPKDHLDHLCRVRNCVNPDHLERVTARENILRGTGPTAELARKTHCKYGHEFSGDNLYVWHGHRGCKACAKIAQSKQRKRK